MVDIVADLLGAAESREIGDRIGEDMVALAGHSGGEAGHILLGHPGIDEAVGEAVGKFLDHAIAKVTDDQGDIVMGFGERGQLFDKGITHRGSPPRSRLRPAPAIPGWDCGNATPPYSP